MVEFNHVSVLLNEAVEGLCIKENGIYVRHWNRPRIDNYLRVTIGTDEQMRALVAFLEKYLQEENND